MHGRAGSLRSEYPRRGGFGRPACRSDAQLRLMKPASASPPDCAVAGAEFEAGHSLASGELLASRAVTGTGAPASLATAPVPTRLGSCPGPRVSRSSIRWPPICFEPSGEVPHQVGPRYVAVVPAAVQADVAGVDDDALAARSGPPSRTRSCSRRNTGGRHGHRGHLAERAHGGRPQIPSPTMP